MNWHPQKQPNFIFKIMFDKTKVKSLTSLKDKAAADITAEEIAAVNTELNEIGLSGIEVSVAGSLKAESDKATEAAANIEKLTADLASANESVSDLTAKLEASNAKVEELTAKLASTPAANPKETPVANDKIEGSDEDFNFENSASAKIQKQFFH